MLLGGLRNGLFFSRSSLLAPWTDGAVAALSSCRSAGEMRRASQPEELRSLASRGYHSSSSSSFCSSSSSSSFSSSSSSSSFSSFHFDSLGAGQLLWIGGLGTSRWQQRSETNTMTSKATPATMMMMMMMVRESRATMASSSSSKKKEEVVTHKAGTTEGATPINKRISVLLTETVEHAGFQGEVVQVKKGFARNYLFPRKLAVHATPENLARMGSDVAEKRAALEKARAEARAQKRISKVTVRMKRHLMSDGRLHAPVSKENIVEKLAKQHKIVVLPDQVFLEEPLTEFGSYRVRVVVDGIESELGVSLEKR